MNRGESPQYKIAERSISKDKGFDSSIQGKLNPVYYSKMSVKSNIFKPVKPILTQNLIKPALDSTQRQDSKGKYKITDRKASNIPDSENSTYFIKNDNKNAINAKQTLRSTLKAVGKVDAHSRDENRRGNANLVVSSTATRWHIATGGNSLERSTST